MLYPKIDTLFNRDGKFKIIEGEFKNKYFPLIEKWTVLEKLDGTNIRIEYHGAHKTFAIGGRTQNSEIPKGIIEYITSTVSFGKLYETFGDKSAVIFGEGIGPKIQKDGELYCPQQIFVPFDIVVNGYWLNVDNVLQISESLGFRPIPLIRTLWEDVGIRALPHKTSYIVDRCKRGFESYFNQDKPAEGIIAKTDPYLFDNHGNRIMFKLKCTDFKNE